ncbi:MAG: hypothetical protein ACKOHI_08715, partial [Phycisphaerales bacterium]
MRTEVGHEVPPSKDAQSVPSTRADVLPGPVQTITCLPAIVRSARPPMHEGSGRSATVISGDQVAPPSRET